jgi:predicted GIY-YIG superfamily endonuclease
MTCYLYTLTFDAAESPVVFYVGRTNNPKRRLAEHRYAVKDLTNQEYKYRWCRELEAIDIEWNLVVIGQVENDEDSEYEWVLKFARKNREQSINFIEDLPLTNMKRGDFFEEMIAERTINTAADIREYRLQRAEEAKAIPFVKAATYDMSGTTPEPTGILAKVMAEWMRNRAPGKFQDFAKEKIQQRELEYQKLINDPARIERIKQATLKLMAEDIDK